MPKRRRTLALAVGVAAVAGLSAVSLAAWKRNGATPAPAPAAVILPDSVGGTAILFNGTTSYVGTLIGTILTPQSDNITVDLMLRWDGQKASEHQMLFYNGHGGVTGWGLMMTGHENGVENGTIAVLAGGITIAGTTLVLKPGIWQHLVAERREGKVTVTLDDQSYDIGAFPVNPLAAKYRHLERTTVGSDGTADAPQLVFQGAIDRVRVLDLASNYFVDRWNFDEGSGPITVGEKGALLYVNNATWTPVPPLVPRDAFWRRMELACGKAYTGTLTDAPQADSALQGASIVLHLRGCQPNAIHAVLHVGNDRSRTFVLTRAPGGLRLTHDVHRADGTRGAAATHAEEVRDSSTLGRQEFAGHAHRWSLEIEPRDYITYSRRGPDGVLRVRFELERTVLSPPPPWSVRR